MTVVVLCCIDPQGVGCDLADVRQTDTMYKQVNKTLIPMLSYDCGYWLGEGDIVDDVTVSPSNSEVTANENTLQQIN